MFEERKRDCHSLVDQALAAKAAGALNQGLASIRQARKLAGDFSNFFLALIQVLVDQDQVDLALALTQQVLQEADQVEALSLYESAMSFLAQTAPSALKEFSEPGLFVRQGASLDREWIDFVFHPDRLDTDYAASNQAQLKNYLAIDLAQDPGQAKACYRILQDLEPSQVHDFIRAYLAKHPEPSLVRTDFLIRLLGQGSQDQLILEGPQGLVHQLDLAELNLPQDRSFYQAGQAFIEDVYFKELLSKVYLEEEWLLLNGLLYPFEDDLGKDPADLVTILAAADPEDACYQTISQLLKGVI